MMKFKIEKHDQSDKRFSILGPDSSDEFISIDYDDVDHKSVDLTVEKMVKILNDNWNDPKYSTEDAELRNWLIDTFASIAEDQGNSEEIENVTIKKKKNGETTIEFTLDAGRAGVHRDNKIVVSKDVNPASTKTWNVKMYLSEIIEGGDIESDFKDAIEEKFNEN